MAAATVPGGTAGGMAEAGGLRVTGEMLVRFDNKMFKDQVATVVGELIKTPYVINGILKGIFP
jgi:hypothetical protein